MRFNTPVFFQRVHSGKYDPFTGDYGEDTIDEEKRYACVNDTEVETLKIVYGGLKQGSRTICLQNHYKSPFDRIRVDGKVYQVDCIALLRTKQVFIVSEVQ